MNSCIFCDIIERTAPATVLYEDTDCIVIKTTEPVSEGHALVIPKQHAVNILDIDEETLKLIAVVTKKVAKQIMKSCHASGVNILHAAGVSAQQSVFHFHFHIVPRYDMDNLDLWPQHKL